MSSHSQSALFVRSGSGLGPQTSVVLIISSEIGLISGCCYGSAGFLMFLQACARCPAVSINSCRRRTV